MIFGMDRRAWALHMVSMHTVLPGTPSVEEMLKYPAAFGKMKADHDQLHARYHTGHEHDGTTGLPIEPPKKKPLFEVVDD